MKNGSAKVNPAVTTKSVDVNNISKSSSISTQSALIYLVIIFVFSIVSLGYVYSMFPELEEEEWQYIKLPRDIEDAKHLGTVLSRYKEKYYSEVLGGVFITYIL